MLISTGILAGTAVFAACVLATDKKVKKKLDDYKPVVDPATSKAYIKCSAEISLLKISRFIPELNIHR